MDDYMIISLFELIASDDLPNVNIMVPSTHETVSYDEALAALRRRDWSKQSFSFKSAALQTITNKLAADAGHYAEKFYIVNEDEYCRKFLGDNFCAANIGNISLLRAEMLDNRGYISFCLPHEAEHATQSSHGRTMRHHHSLTSDYIREPMEIEARVAGYKFVIKNRLPFNNALKCAVKAGKFRFLYRLDKIKAALKQPFKDFQPPIIAAAVVPDASARLKILKEFCRKNILSASTVFGNLTAIETPNFSGSFRSLFTKRRDMSWADLSFGEKLHTLKQTERDFCASYGGTARPVSTFIPSPGAIAFFGGKSAVCCNGTIYINSKDINNFEKMSALDFRKIPERSAPTSTIKKYPSKKGIFIEKGGIIRKR